MSNILITGAAGFIGFQLANFQQQTAHKVFIFDNYFKNKSEDNEFKNLIKKKMFFFIN